MEIEAVQAAQVSAHDARWKIKNEGRGLDDQQDAEQVPRWARQTKEARKKDEQHGAQNAGRGGDADSHGDAGNESFVQRLPLVGSAVARDETLHAVADAHVEQAVVIENG